MNFTKKSLFFFLGLSVSLIILLTFIYFKWIKTVSILRKPRGAEVRVAEALKSAGLELYPGSILLDQSSQEMRKGIPSATNPNEQVEITTSRIVMVSADSIVKIQGFYGGPTPYVISENRSQGELSFLELSSVTDLRAADEKIKLPVILIEIRKKRLNQVERAAFEAESVGLKTLKKPDLVQKRRVRELERLLKEQTFIQIQIKSWHKLH